MDISTATMSSYAQMALGFGGGHHANVQEDPRTTLVVEVVEGVQAAYDLAEEVTATRKAVEREERAAQQHVEQKPLQDSDADTAEPGASLSAVAVTPEADTARAAEARGVTLDLTV